MEATIINKALAQAGLPPLSSETQPSQEPSGCESSSEPKTPRPILARGWPTESPEFRKELFRLDETHDPRVKDLALCGEWYVRALANNQREQGTTLMLSGPAGTGKTHIARAIYRYVQAWGVDIMDRHNGKHPMARWIDWPDIAEADDQTDFEDACYEIDRSNFFVLDDIGSESDRFKNAVPTSRLRRILSRTEGKWIIATTNLPREECLNFYDTRVADRLDSFRWFTMPNVPSYRSKL